MSRWVLSGAQCVPSAVLIKYNGDTDAFCYVFGGHCGYSGKAEGSGIEVLKFSDEPRRFGRASGPNLAVKQPETQRFPARFGVDPGPPSALLWALKINYVYGQGGLARDNKGVKRAEPISTGSTPNPAQHRRVRAFCRPNLAPRPLEIDGARLTVPVGQTITPGDQF